MGSPCVFTRGVKCVCICKRIETEKKKTTETNNKKRLLYEVAFCFLHIPKTTTATQQKRTLENIHYYYCYYILFYSCEFYGQHGWTVVVVMILSSNVNKRSCARIKRQQAKHNKLKTNNTKPNICHSANDSYLSF